MTRRASILMVVTVRHPRLPFGVLCVPCFSFALYLLAWGVRVGMRFVPRERAVKSLPLSAARLGWLLTRAAEVLLWSGSYTLLEVHVPPELSVRVWLV